MVMEAAQGLWEEFWKKPPHVTRVAHRFPLLQVLDDGKTILTKNSNLVRVIEVRGRDYTGMAEEQADFLYELRKQFFESTPPGILISSHALRHRVGQDINEHEFDDPVMTGLMSRWHGQFRESYRNRHVIVVRTSRGSRFSDMLANVGKQKGGEASRYEKMERLESATNLVLSRLDDYRPRVLEQSSDSSELLSYWAWLVNGHPMTFHPDHPVFDDLIAGTDLFWPEGKEHQEYIGSRKRYSAWLAIKVYPNKPSGHMLDLLFRLPRDLSLHQSFQFMTKEEAKRYIEDWMKYQRSFIRFGEIIDLELREAMNRVESEEIKLCEHAYALQVFGDSEADLNRAVEEVEKAIISRGITVARERAPKAQELLFWSIFPEREHLNTRARPITSENAANFVTFSSIGEGLDRCSFGDEPVTMFRTLTGSDYSFTFHASPEPMGLGHTVIVGGSNSGKTTLISFLLACCRRYPKFRALAFDRFHGMEVMTRLLGGDYEDFGGESRLNPLHLPDNQNNRSFLAHWFEVLTEQSNDAARAEINLAIDQAYRLDSADRRLEEIATAFGLKKSGSVRAALEKWLPDGQFGHFFNGKRDALSFDKWLVTLDATTILDLPEVLGSMTLYLFHRLRMTVLDDPGPYCIFIDEMNKYLETAAFGPGIRNLGQEIRKTDGVLIGAVQEASSLLENEYGRKLIDNTATYLLFPSATAEHEHYVKGLGLTESEFKWIKTPSKRLVMVKRREGESTIINVDLSAIGNYLKVFDSAATSVRRLNTLRKQRSEEWRNAYLTS